MFRYPSHDTEPKLEAKNASLIKKTPENMFPQKLHFYAWIGEQFSSSLLVLGSKTDYEPLDGTDIAKQIINNVKK